MAGPAPTLSSCIVCPHLETLASVLTIVVGEEEKESKEASDG